MKGASAVRADATGWTAADLPAREPARAAAWPRWRVNAVDAYFAVSLALFLCTSALAYHDRWTAYAGPGRDAEFLLYAAVALFGIAAAWTCLRRIPYPTWLLVVVQVGVVAHFAGGLVHFGDQRLYAHEFLGFRYDKYVHLAAAFIGAIVLQESCRIAGLPVTRATRCLAFLALLGVGCLVELAEYAVKSRVPRQSVDPLTDTMGDLLANVCGGALYLAIGTRVAAALSRCRRDAATEAAP